MGYGSGRHFLQIPGPTNVPERVARAIGRSTIDHRGPEFARLATEVLDGLKEVFRTSGTVVVYPSSGTGAGEAALVAADGRALARALRVAGKVDPLFVDDIGEMARAIADQAKDGDVVIVMGAGSIGNVPGQVVDIVKERSA